MIETKNSRKKFERETGRTLGPTQKEVAQEHFEVEKHPPKKSGKFLVSTRPRDRAGYMRKYRARAKTCPHCGKPLS
jgi:hypothetical protein